MINRPGSHHCLGNVRCNYAKHGEHRAKTFIFLSILLHSNGKTKQFVLMQLLWVWCVLVCMCFFMSGALGNAACQFSWGLHLTWLDCSRSDITLQELVSPHQKPHKGDWLWAIMQHSCVDVCVSAWCISVVFVHMSWRCLQWVLYKLTAPLSL